MLERQFENTPVTQEKTIKVPPGVKNAVRDGYKDGKAKGLSWQFDGKRLVDAVNTDMTTHIKNFIKGWNPTYNDPTVVNQALTRYFQTKKQEKTAMNKNKLEAEKKKRASYERKKEKAKRRLTALDKMESLPSTKRAKIKQSLETKYMSSDEECQDGFITHQPSWQSPRFKEYKEKLDNKFKETCTNKSKRLLTKRTIGNEAQKEKPDLPEDLAWIAK